MKIEEGAILYCMRNGTTPTQCKVHYMNFGGDGTHLLTYLPDNQAFVANDIDLAETAEECERAYHERIQEEYRLYYESLDSKEKLLLHLLESSIDGRKIEGTERKAIESRISEFTQINISEYLAKVNELKKESERA